MPNHNDVIKIAVSTLENIVRLMETKGQEYTRGSQDCLDNFRRGGVSLSLPMEAVWHVYANKHWDSITSYIRDQIKETNRSYSEPMEGRVDDMITYLLLFKIMLQERNHYTTGQAGAAVNSALYAQQMNKG